MSKIVRTLATVLVSLWVAGIYSASTVKGTDYTEAPTGFDNQTNGLVEQKVFDHAKSVFEEVDDAKKGLGPVYNAQSCAECHQNPITGGISQITELRVGRLLDGVFTDRPGGSLINDRATDTLVQERAEDADVVRSFRTTLNTLGDGFVEAIPDETFTAIRKAQPPALRGRIIMVPVLEADTATMRVGRFGWKNQHASLVSFSGDAYLNEQGITNRLFGTENTSNGNSVEAYDHYYDAVADRYVGLREGIDIVNEDPDNDVDVFARFMRATKAPSRGLITAQVTEGEAVFNATGCNICHTPTIATMATNSWINGHTFQVTEALGNKVIHPFSDFLLHDVGTGDGIVQNGGRATRNKLRTPPLWGVRSRTRLMHDGNSITYERAILRHRGQAEPVTLFFRALSQTQKNKLYAFLNSL
jgi:CxxC motif-containing protein (DUF1111 family)